VALVTLTSDWKNDDFYVGAIKGVLYSSIPRVNVVDITHKIDSYKFTQAAFIIRNSFLHFPEGTIHIVSINSEITETYAPVCIKIRGQYFIGTASGIFSLIFSEKPERIVRIHEREGWYNSSFPDLTLYAKAAAHIATGGDISDLGNDYVDEARHIQLMPVYDEYEISGSIIYIDSYSNIFTNITRRRFEQVCRNRRYTISFKSESYKIQKLSNTYNEVEVADMLALFNSLDLLEIAMRNARLSELVGLRINDPVIIKFRS